MDTRRRTQTIFIKYHKFTLNGHCVSGHPTVHIMQLTNVVCSANVGYQLNLRELCYQLTNVRYNPKQFPGLVWQHRSIGGNCLVFSNGKLQCQGKARTLQEGIKRLRRYARMIQKLGYRVILREVNIVTVTAFHTLSGPLDIPALARERRIIYEPELFPTANFQQEGLTFCCFQNGKIVINGIKRTSDVDHIVMPTLMELELFTT